MWPTVTVMGERENRREKQILLGLYGPRGGWVGAQHISLVSARILVRDLTEILAVFDKDEVAV